MNAPKVPLVQLSDVTLQYGRGTIALDHTDLQIAQGDFVALVGPSGCGKSTILKLVAGLLGPSSGGVLVDGREFTRAGAAFVKTSTGFGKGGATVEDVALMRSLVGGDIGVKASGGVRTAEDVVKMAQAGANRIGASASVAIVSGKTSGSDKAPASKGY